jgi:hypothetical protein
MSRRDTKRKDLENRGIKRLEKENKNPRSARADNAVRVLVWIAFPMVITLL